ncbi:hypothetical protein BK004_01535 [bacterium CG10_46_32]|nr:MAG: hypothetical protein BK004_01535 [bacterium CG10_46_32]PIR56267.1 MAG: hypothetical protein COU73_01555 [Parcubacteria group bacterium CG10_big_fil_rev_8_21_14_0_10_46_32]
MNRREFCYLGVVAALSGVGCGNRSPQGPEDQDVDMEESEASVVAALGGLPVLIDDLAQRPGSNQTYRVRDASGTVVPFKMGFHQNHKGDTQFAITREDGKRAFVGFGLFSGLRILDERGNEIAHRSVISSKATFAAKSAQGLDPEQWMKNGIAVAGIALAAWLGLSAFQFVAAGLGTIAIAGLVIGGAVFVAGFVAQVLAHIGWNIDDFRALFGGTLESIRNIIVGVARTFQETYSV